MAQPNLPWRHTAGQPPTPAVGTLHRGRVPSPARGQPQVAGFGTKRFRQEGCGGRWPRRHNASAVAAPVHPKPWPCFPEPPRGSLAGANATAAPESFPQVPVRDAGWCAAPWSSTVRGFLKTACSSPAAAFHGTCQCAVSVPLSVRFPFGYPVKMEGNHLSNRDAGDGPRPIGRILASKKPRPAPKVEPAITADPGPPPDPVYEPEPEQEPPNRRRPLNFTFVPFPTALVDLELRQILPPVQLRVLHLRRFAHPVNGEWLSSTLEVAELVGCDRSTAHKALWSLCAARYLHIRYHRSSTVQLILHFGGFAHPGYLAEGKPLLIWDGPGTVPDAGFEHLGSQRGIRWHSADRQENGSNERGMPVLHTPAGTGPRNIKEEKEEFAVRYSKDFSPGLGKTPASYLLVESFQPSSHDESVVQELARKMGEKYMNGFLQLRRTYGRNRLEKACTLAADKRFDKKAPLRGRPGAYVRWLLESGKC